MRKVLDCLEVILKTPASLAEPTVLLARSNTVAKDNFELSDEDLINICVCEYAIEINNEQHINPEEITFFYH